MLELNVGASGDPNFAVAVPNVRVLVMWCDGGERG